MTVIVPATTANLGPGYDCLGVALRIYNKITVRNQGQEPLPPMVAEAGKAFFKATRLDPLAFSWEIEASVPSSRGLGSSVTVRMGVLEGLNMLCGSPLEREEIFKICAKLEGHPDNAAPAAFGGFTVATGEEAPQRFDVSELLRFILLIPDFEVSTPAARKVLPEQIDRLSAVKSAANACRITAALASGDYEALRGTFGDWFHQPFRQALIPMLPDVIRAGEEAGALGGFLSGSGSTIACVTIDDPDAVGEAMLAAAKKANVEARFIETCADNEGARLNGGE